MRGMLDKSGACLAVAFAVILVVSGIPVAARGGTDHGNGPTGGSSILVVGEQDKMKTRNPLPALANDVWTHDVLDRIYDTVGKSLPETEEIKPYILKGIDANENGVFDASEYGVFTKNPATNPLDVVAYYDFNGVYFHDGVQANASDLFFSYQLQAMNPRMNVDLRVLMDKAGKAGSNYSVTRWLFMIFAPKAWQNEPAVGDPNLRFAVRFQLQEPFALFSNKTLAGCTLFPRHVWEGTGWRLDPGGVVTPLHADFGQAIYPERDQRFGKGVPTTETIYTPYKYLDSSPAQDSAEEWQPTDDDVIGTGPFYFDNFDDASAIALVLRNADYYSGNDSRTGQTIDPLLTTYVHAPHINGIRFVVYSSLTLAMLALESGTIDYYHARIPPEFLPELTINPDIQTWTTPGMGFAYLSYNMRRPAIGTWHYGQADQFDIGLHFRKAVSHLINKTMIVQDFLQGYGEVGVVPVSPNNVRFYNASIAVYDFSDIQALAELDLAHQDAVWLSNNGGGAEAATWYTKDSGTGKYILPGIGTSEFSLWCPNAGYDPVRANSCTMIANEMNNIGINVKAKPTAFSTITSLINAHDFDMYLLGWEICTTDPDYLFDLFYSANAAMGMNYGGFNDPLSDYVLDESRMERDGSTRAWFIKWEQGILADKLPYDTLFYPTCIEAERKDRFVGWIRDVCSIWNYWSLLNLTPVGVSRPPVALFTISPPAGGISTTFAFDASSSYDTEDPPSALEVRWDWEDDGIWDTAWSAVKTAQHQYSSAGSYTVRLEVRDTDFDTNSTTDQVSVWVDSPTVSITWPTPGQILTQTPITATGTASDTAGSGLQRIEVRVNGGGWVDALGTSFWTAGVALVPGPNTIEARAWDNAGNQSAPASVTVILNTPPAASFSILPDGGDTDTVFTMSVTASDDQDSVAALGFRWDWENDGTWDTNWSDATTIHHQYAHLGTYYIALEVRDTGGLTNGTIEHVRVRLAPPFDLNAEGGAAPGTVRIAWDHSTPEDVDHYRVAVYDSADATQPVRNETSVTPEFDVTGLESGKMYWFDIVAVDTAGNTSNPSERISGIATPNPPPEQFPSWGVVAAIIAVSLIAIAAFILLRRRRKEPEDERKEGT
jgi:ABC-type transport system substrate-binding protein